MPSTRYQSIRIAFIGTLLISSVLASLGLPWALADDHRKFRSHHVENQSGFHDHKSNDKGNETTGQTAAWIFAAANLSVLLSITTKGINRFTPISKTAKDQLKRFNLTQKKYLMPLHYTLNPLALCFAFLHFALSHCHSSSLPEWGLAAMASLGVIGIMMKFKLSPRGLRRHICQLHTSPLPLSLLLIILFLGHHLVD